MKSMLGWGLTNEVAILVFEKSIKTLGVLNFYDVFFIFNKFLNAILSFRKQQLIIQ
tara:strand:- start:14346 stop:14513 length:168 start_codon:yes stop_codon:yes gene_type:complete